MALPSRVPSFFAGSTPLGGGFLYLSFADSTTGGTGTFGYYDLDLHPLIYQVGLGFEYVFDANVDNDGNDGIYLYDFASGDFFYTNRTTLPPPYFYDFTRQSVLYFYLPAAGTPVGSTRYFYDFALGEIITF